MTVTITFTADNAERLREQMSYFLNGPGVVRTAPAPEPETIGQTGPLPGDIVTAEGDYSLSVERAEPFEAKTPEPTKPRRAHRATKPAPEKEPVQEPEEPAPEVEPEDPGPDEKDIINGADPVAAEALKKQVIEQLAGLFTAGKVKVVRHVLDKYGQGAKSFPEIDASQFPAIRDAIARGETA